MTRFTIVCDYEGGTYVSQVRASDAVHSLTAWAGQLQSERPIPDTSDLIAEAALQTPDDIVPLDGLTGVWCWTGSVREQLVLAHIIETV